MLFICGEKYLITNQLANGYMKILTTKKIILVGGGIGGTATALALYRAGFEPIVYKRTATLREVGAGVALWANATHVLKELGVLNDVLRQSDPITNYQLFSQMELFKHHVAW